MDNHETILAETSDILKLSFDRMQHAQKEAQSKEAIPQKHREAVQRLTLDLQEERQRSNELEATVSQLTEQLTDYETESEELKRRLEQMTKELESVCASNSELERELFKRQRVHAQTEELESSLQEKDAAIKEWHEHLAELEEKFSKLEEENQELREELQHAAAAQQETAELKKQCESQSQELTQIRRFPDDLTVDRLKHDLANSQELRNRLAETNRRITVELQQKKSEVAELMQENSRLESELRAAAARCDSLEEAVAGLKKERGILSETVENLQEVTQRQSRDLLEAARREGSDQHLIDVTTRLNEEMRRRLSDKAAFRSLLQKDKEAFTSKIAEKDALIASLRERQSNWTPEIAYRTSEQLASMSAQLLQEREKRFAVERSLSVSSRQELRRELYERKVSSLM